MTQPQSGAPQDGVPRRIGPYLIERRLGHGGMGVVYLGWDEATGVAVAVKVIRPEFADDPRLRARLRREARAASRVPRFCTATVLRAEIDARPAFIATEYIEGPTLDLAIAEQGPLRGSALEELAVGVALALRAIHHHGVIHRDLKPSNVVLSQIGPRVIDFGIARLEDSQTLLTHDGGIIGTPAFMSPEQLRGDRVTTATDIFGWAGLVTYAATGRRPFGNDNAEIRSRLLVEGLDLSALEDPLLGLVQAAFNKYPARRPTATELIDHLVGGAPGTVNRILETAATVAPTTLVTRPDPTRQEDHYGQENPYGEEKPRRQQATRHQEDTGTRVWTWNEDTNSFSGSFSSGSGGAAPWVSVTVDFGERSQADQGTDADLQPSASTSPQTVAPPPTAGRTRPGSRAGSRPRWRPRMLQSAIAVFVLIVGVTVYRLADNRGFGSELAGFEGHGDLVTDVATTTIDGRPIAVSTSYDKTVRLWDLTTRKPIGDPMTGHGCTVWNVAVGELNGAPIAVTGGGSKCGGNFLGFDKTEDFGVRVWDLRKRRQLGAPLQGLREGIVGVATGELAGRPVAVGFGRDEEHEYAERMWDLATHRPVDRPRRLSGSDVATLDGRLVAITRDKRSIRVWDLGTERQIGRTLPARLEGGVELGTLNGRTIVLAHEAGSHVDRETFRAWDLETGRQAGGTIAVDDSSSYASVWCAGVSKGRTLVVTGNGTSKNNMRVWDVATGQLIGKPFTAHKSGVDSMAISEVGDRTVVVTGSDRGKVVRMWDITPPPVTTPPPTTVPPA